MNSAENTVNKHLAKDGEQKTTVHKVRATHYSSLSLPYINNFNRRFFQLLSTSTSSASRRRRNTSPSTARGTKTTTKPKCSPSPTPRSCPRSTTT